MARNNVFKTITMFCGAFLDKKEKICTSNSKSGLTIFHVVSSIKNFKNILIYFWKMLAKHSYTHIYSHYIPKIIPSMKIKHPTCLCFAVIAVKINNRYTTTEYIKIHHNQQQQPKKRRRFQQQQCQH